MSQQEEHNNNNNNNNNNVTLHVVKATSQGQTARLARGAFGEITLAVLHHRRHQETETDADRLRWVAIKKDNNSNDTNLCEIDFLKTLNPHPNVIQLLNTSDNDSTVIGGGGEPSRELLILPYCSMDLHTVLEWKRLDTMEQHQQRGHLLSQSTLHRIASHLFAALQHCHEHNIVHMDVKPGNLLVHAETASIQLCDFGIATKQKQQAPSPQQEQGNDDTNGTSQPMGNDDFSSFQQQRQPRALCTLQYRPPELLLGALPEETAHASMDMFSAGVTMADCIAGHLNFGGSSDLAQLSLYFQTLGTPGTTATHWPDVIKLPDWGKLTFAAHPHNPEWHVQTIPRLAEFPNTSALSQIVQNTVQLDPKKRWSAGECLQQLQQQQQPLGEREQRQSDEMFVREMVPPCLRQTPLLLTPPNGCYDVIDQQILETAKTRRELLSSLQPWNVYTNKKEGTTKKEKEKKLDSSSSFSGNN